MPSVTTLARVCKIFHVDPSGRRSPVEIANVGRNDLAEAFGQLGFRRGAEIGVETGIFSEQLCRRNLGVSLMCVDAWRAYAGYREHVSQEKLDGFYTTAGARLAPFGCELVRRFSVEAARDVPNESLDFVYIDANHEFSHVVADLTAWVPKVRRGGIVSGHDYVRRVDNGYQVHVVEAVHGYTGAYHVNPWFVLGAKAVVEGEVRERPRSYFWVRA